MIFASGWSLANGYTFWSTIAPTPVVNTAGHTESGAFSLNVTVFPDAVTVFIAVIRAPGSCGLLILRTRLKEYATSAPVTGSPFEKYCLGLTMQTDRKSTRLNSSH